ncbi:hypothetical protein BKA67DRAFT_643816 [Truncatella angustata]|uniref:Uncharacterized protein n=1 Tax=Truncatella angustata TaxID=152316 RepID=A0A9P8UT58_9PEZI|nr:uncharacterized protein BKA67DRAFT_643816 [Truncatella angustata]KAH6657884.1 hypothetical protein BKA67DRAFT_643816 [Truncatella angustata]
MRSSPELMNAIAMPVAVEYKAGVNSVFADSTKAYLTTFKRLDLLGLCAGCKDSEHPVLPTWATNSFPVRNKELEANLLFGDHDASIIHIYIVSGKWIGVRGNATSAAYLSSECRHVSDTMILIYVGLSEIRFCHRIGGALPAHRCCLPKSFLREVPPFAEFPTGLIRILRGYVGSVQIPFKSESIHAKYITEINKVRIIALMLDLIAVLDHDSGKPWACLASNTAGLAIGGAAAFGYDSTEYKPLGTYVELMSVISEYSTGRKTKYSEDQRVFNLT